MGGWRWGGGFRRSKGRGERKRIERKEDSGRGKESGREIMIATVVTVAHVDLVDFFLSVCFCKVNGSSSFFM